MKSTKLDKIILAVDSEETTEKLSDYDYEIVMTSENHNSGTDRVNEVANKFPEADVVINIQGDEPLLDPKMIDDLVCLMEEPDVEMATILSKKLTVSDLLNPNVVKAIMDEDHNAVEFKRNVFAGKNEGHPWYLCCRPGDRPVPYCGNGEVSTRDLFL